MSKLNSFVHVANVVKVPLYCIDNAHYNPKDRTNVDRRDIQGLADELASTGQLMPILLKRKKDRFDCIEGHRRIAAHKLLERDFIYAIITDDAPSMYKCVEMATMYRSINGEAREHSGYQYLESFLKDTGTVGWSLGGRLNKMIGFIGRAVAEKMVAHRKGYSFYNSRAYAIAVWLGRVPCKKYKKDLQLTDTQMRDLQSIIHWLMDVDGAESNGRAMMEKSKKYGESGEAQEVMVAWRENRKPRCC
jgi:hypothetical protein